eukprot:scaffold30819_cov21-Cyclotella_meneghiniana.AAC.1
MGRKQQVTVDPTAWMLDNEIANFLLLNQKEVLYMCMLGYTFLHGSKVFASTKDKPISYKLVIPLANDAYPIAILVSFAIHHYFPIVSDVMNLAPAFK